MTTANDHFSFVARWMATTSVLCTFALIMVRLLWVIFWCWRWSMWPTHLTYLPDLPTWLTYLTYPPNQPTFKVILTFHTYSPGLPNWPSFAILAMFFHIRVFYSGFNFWNWWSTWVATENRQTRPSCPTWNSSSVRSSLYSDEVSFSFGLWHIKDMLLCDTWQITRLAEHNFHSNSFDERESFCRWQLLQLNSCELQ